MGWLLLAALCTTWAVFLLPRRKNSPDRSVEEFERRMDLLADTEGNGQGRWIVTPRKGVAFVGARERAKARARERRRRLFVFMLESIGLTFLIGLVPPLRAMWYGTGGLFALLGVYVWLLLSTRAHAQRHAVGARDVVVPEQARPVRERYATDAGAGTPRPAFNGLAVLGGDDLVNIVVRPAGRQVEVAGV
jgi:hypothetical protein